MTETTTALTLVVPKELHDAINSIRKTYDKAFPRWMPHINFLFPFVPEERFNEIKTKLEPVLKSFGSFKVDLNEIGYFKQAKGMTVHISPRDPTKLQALFEVIRNTIPDVIPKRDGFHPHLTIAQFSTANFEEHYEDLRLWLRENDFEFTVDHICILQRSKTDINVPFSVHSTIPLY